MSFGHGKSGWRRHMGVPAVRFRPRNAVLSSLLGYAAPLALGLGALKFVTAIYTWLEMLGSEGSSPLATVFAWSQLGCIPFGMGVVASYFWIDEREIGGAAGEARRDLRGSIWLQTLLCCAGAAGIESGTAPLLIVAAPLICFGMWLGARMGQNWWRRSGLLVK